MSDEQLEFVLQKMRECNVKSHAKDSRQTNRKQENNTLYQRDQNTPSPPVSTNRNKFKYVIMDTPPAIAKILK